MKFLIINAAGIGDFFEIIRWLYFIKKQKPDYVVDLMVSDRVYDYAKRCPYVRQVFCMRTRGENVVFSLDLFEKILRIREEDYDLIINTFPTYNLLGDVKMYFFIRFISLWGRIKTYGVRREERFRIYNKDFLLKNDESVYLKYGEIFKTLGIYDETETSFSEILWYDKTKVMEKYKEVSGRRIIFVNPFSNSTKKMFCEGLWSDLLNRVTEVDKNSLFAIFPADMDYFNRLFNNLKPIAKDKILLIKEFDDWIFMIGKSLMVLTVDSATVHIASLLNKKTFVILPSDFDFSKGYKPYRCDSIFYCIGEFD
ncbi:MAG: glycosyltransferase family 9 protein, partial [Elusimicrobiales bacterium]